MSQDEIDEKVAAADLAESELIPLYEECHNKLALVYSAVLQWNLAARFDKSTHFDEACRPVNETALPDPLPEPYPRRIRRRSTSSSTSS